MSLDGPSHVLTAQPQLPLWVLPSACDLSLATTTSRIYTKLLFTSAPADTSTRRGAVRLGSRRMGAPSVYLAYVLSFAGFILSLSLSARAFHRSITPAVR